MSSIILPPNIKSLAIQSLRNTGILKIEVPKSVSVIKISVFELNSNLAEVSFEEGINLIELGGAVFKNCPSLRRIELPDTIEIIGDYIFSKCTSLEFCHYPENSQITQILKNCFADCTSLKELPMTEYITSLGDDTFSNCTSLSGNIDLIRITDMRYRCFFGCLRIESVDIDNLETIYDETFRNCTSLKSVQFSRNIKTIRQRAFQNTAIENLDLSYAEGLEIGQYAFADMSSLKNLSLPNTCTLVGGCFQNTGIQTLIIKAGTTFLYGNQFYACKELTYVEVEEGVTSIPQNCFGFAVKLKTIIFPSTITEVGQDVLHGNGWLSTLICKAIVPPTVTGSGYIGYGPFNVMYVPDESVDAYKATPGWSNHVSQIKPLSMLS